MSVTMNGDPMTMTTTGIDLRSRTKGEMDRKQWSRDKMAGMLDVSFPTLNGWLNGGESAKAEQSAARYFGVDARDMPGAANGHATSAGPPALPGFTLPKPLRNFTGGEHVKVEITETETAIRLYAGMRRRYGIEIGDRIYVYIADDGSRLALVPAPKADTANSLPVCANGALMCRYLRDRLLAAGWASGTVTPRDIPGQRRVIVIERPA